MQILRFAKPILFAALCVLLLLALDAAAFACPNCKNSLAASDPSGENIASGYFYSILFMMSMPFLLLGSFGSYMYLEVRRARAKEKRPDASGEEEVREASRGS